ncbi:MAG: response regulator [bacterium]|nr:response regulator [bacterium]
MDMSDLDMILAGKTILVIDDDPDSLEIAQTLLIKTKVNVVTAQDGAQALKILDATRPDYIISDLSMPNMSGWELIKIIKAERQWMDIPIFALTAHAMAGDRVKAIAAGFHNYLTKPLNPSTFINDLLKLIHQLPS